MFFVHTVISFFVTSLFFLFSLYLSCEMTSELSKKSGKAALRAKHAASLELWYSVQALSIFKLTLCFQTSGTYTVKFYDGVVQTVKNIHVKAFSKDQVSSVFLLKLMVRLAEL